MENKYEWKLTDIYKTEADYKKDKERINELLEEIKQFKGKLKDSSENIYNCYKIFEEIAELIGKIYAYGMFKYHKDLSNPEGIKLFKDAESLDAKIDETTSFMVPELTDIDTKVLENYLNENKELQRYKRLIEEIIKNKKHILSKDVEDALSRFSDVFNGVENAYDILTNAEIKFPSIKGENGEELELSEATYSKLLSSKNREIRKQASTLLVSEYGKYINTITELYLNRVNEYTKMARLRNYNSSLEKAVDEDDATVEVYNKLISTVNENLNINYEYTKLKKHMLKLPEIHMYDMYVNPFTTEEKYTDIEEAKAIILKALEPLGEEYIAKLKEAFESNWMDVYKAPNKRSGGYNMSVYGVHPYILLNYEGTTNDVSTVAHEFGHAMHSYYACESQNVLDSNYTILTAEIASTVNEILLAQYRIETAKTKEEKMALLYDRIETVRATLLTQSMFAEFEKEVHSNVESGNILNSTKLGEIYLELNKKYYGKDLIIDDYNKYNWARIPHFYSCFYVYKYATGISSAIEIATRILNKEDGFVEKYINMLKLGGSKKSLDILKTVDIDLEDSKVYKNALEFYANDIKKLMNLWDGTKSSLR